jgi:hypothetical protein
MKDIVLLGRRKYSGSFMKLSTNAHLFLDLGPCGVACLHGPRVAHDRRS